MRCHYCEDEATMAVEKGDVKVGLCKQHFRDRLEELKSEGWLDDLRDELNTDRIE